MSYYYLRLFFLLLDMYGLLIFSFLLSLIDFEMNLLTIHLPQKCKTTYVPLLKIKINKISIVKIKHVHAYNHCFSTSFKSFVIFYRIKNDKTLKTFIY